MSNNLNFANLLERSFILNTLRSHITKYTKNRLYNIKYISLFIMSLISTSILGTMLYFLFNFLTFYSSLRCVLWLIESYKPNETYTNNTEITAHDIIEYCIIPIFLRILVILIPYIPMPFISPIIYFLCIIISMVSITNRYYRQKFCITVKYMFVDKTYVHGKEKEIHKLLQLLVYSFDRVNIYIFNIIYNPRNILNKLNDINTFDEAFHILTTYIDNNIKQD